MNTNSTLFSTTPVSQDIFAPVSDTVVSTEPQKDSSPQFSELEALFGSILNMQLEDEGAAAPHDAISLLANADAVIGNQDKLAGTELNKTSDLEIPIGIVSDELLDLPRQSLIVTENTLTEETNLVLPIPSDESGILMARGLPGLISNTDSSEDANVVATQIDAEGAHLRSRLPLAEESTRALPNSINLLSSNETEALESEITAALSNAAGRGNPLITNSEESNIQPQQSVITTQNPVKESELKLQAEVSSAVAPSKVNSSDTISSINSKVLVNHPDSQAFGQNPPLAGSLATLSDEVVQSNRQAVDVEIVLATESKQTEWSGNSIPPNGKKLPGNLPFLTNYGNSALQADSISDFTNSDFTNRAISHTQQLLFANDSQPVPQQLVQSDAASTALNISQYVNGEKMLAARNPAILNSENVTNFVIESQAGSADWSNQVGNKIRWMSKVNISSAELLLHPAELGAVKINISTEDDQAKVSFVTTNIAAKEVIEASLPRLRDLLSSSGLQLEQSDVSQENLSENKTDQEKTPAGNTVRNEPDMVEENTALLVRQQSLNQIDHYV